MCPNSVFGTSTPWLNSALPIPVPKVSISTVPFSPIPAPNVISATPAASASFSTRTGLPAAWPNSAPVSIPIQAGSRLAAVLVTPSVTTPGKVMPTGPDQLNEVVSCFTTSATASGGARRGDLLPVGEQLSRGHIHGRCLDAGTADVNAECVHGPSVMNGLPHCRPPAVCGTAQSGNIARGDRILSREDVADALVQGRRHRRRHTDRVRGRKLGARLHL